MSQAVLVRRNAYLAKAPLTDRVKKPLRAQPLESPKLFAGKMVEALDLDREECKAQPAKQSQAKSYSGGRQQTPKSGGNNNSNSSKQDQGKSSGNNSNSNNNSKRAATATAVAREESPPTEALPPNLPEEAVGNPRSQPPSPLTVQSLASFDVVRPLPHIKVGGRLIHFFDQWSKVTSDQHILNIIKNGITLSFEVWPSLSTQPVFSSRPGRNLALLSSNIQEMLQKGAIEKVTENSPGFYSHLFLVPKKTGDLRPIINLKFLNNHIVKEKFKMETQRAIRKALTQGDWVTPKDLKDAYFSCSGLADGQEISPVHSSPGSLPVQGPTVQSDICASGILQCNRDSRSNCPSTKHQSSFIPGRLAPQSTILPKMSPRYCNNPASNQQPRIHHQRREVRTSSDATVFIPGRRLRPGAGSSPSHTSKISSNRNSLRIIEKASSSGSSPHPQSPGRDECHGRRHPFGTSPHAPTAAVPFKPVVHVHTTLVLPNLPQLPSSRNIFYGGQTFTIFAKENFFIYLQRHCARTVLGWDGGHPSTQSTWSTGSGTRRLYPKGASTGWNSKP